MEHSRNNFLLSALTGFLLILPFLAVAFIFDISRRLDTFNPGDLVLFAFLWLGLTIIALVLMPIVRYKVTPDVATEPQRFLAKPAVSAVIGFLLALPFLLTLSLLLLKIQPPVFVQYFVANTEPDEPNILSAIVMLGMHLLALAACFVARAPIVQTLRAGGSLFAHPLNLLLVSVILFIFASFVLGIIMDQFPCWIGVPNCD